MPLRESSLDWSRGRTITDIRSTHLSPCERHLGIDLLAVGPDWLEGSLPLSARTRDVVGNSFCGAIAILAEALGGIAANLCLEGEKQQAVGQTLEVHYFERITSGTIVGRALPISITDSNHLWRIEMRDVAGLLLSTSTLSLTILDRK